MQKHKFTSVVLLLMQTPDGAKVKNTILRICIKKFLMIAQQFSSERKLTMPHNVAVSSISVLYIAVLNLFLFLFYFVLMTITVNV